MMYFIIILIILFLIAVLYSKASQNNNEQNLMEEYRNLAIGTITHLKYTDYDETSALKKYYSEKKPNDIRTIWKNVPENIDVNESREIFDSPLKFSGVSHKQDFLVWNDTKIYFTESIQLTSIIDILIEYSQTNPEYFGVGTKKLNSLLIEKFKVLFPKEAIIPNGTSKAFYDSDLAYYQHIVTHLKREYLLFITKDRNDTYFKLIIPLFRAESDGEYIGGLLHLLQHLQVNGNPISAKNKTQKGDTEFYSDLLFTNIIEAFFKIVEQNKNIQDSGTVNFDFINSQSVRLKGGFFYNSVVDVWFINSIMQK